MIDGYQHHAKFDDGNLVACKLHEAELSLIDFHFFKLSWAPDWAYLALSFTTDTDCESMACQFLGMKSSVRHVIDRNSSHTAMLFAAPKANSTGAQFSFFGFQLSSVKS